MTKRLTFFKAEFPRFCLLLFCVLLTISTIRAEWKTFGVFSRIAETKANRVILETSTRSKISVEFFYLNVVRIRYAANGTFERDFSYAFDSSNAHQTPKIKVSQTAKELILANADGAKVVVQQSPLPIEIWSAAIC